MVIGPGFPFPIVRPSDFDHRNDFGSRSGEKAFVGDENIVSREIRLGNFDIEFACNVKHDPPRDPSQRSGANRRSEDLAVLDDEKDYRQCIPRCFPRHSTSTLHPRSARFASIRAMTLFK